MRSKINSDQGRLSHILDAIQNIEEFVEGADKATFLIDKRMQSSVLYQFLIIGEAVASLSIEFTSQTSYPWHKPRAFRNFIAHEYFGIKMWMVWNTIIGELPKLKSIIESAPD